MDKKVLILEENSKGFYVVIYKQIFREEKLIYYDFTRFGAESFGVKLFTKVLRCNLCKSSVEVTNETLYNFLKEAREDALVLSPHNRETVEELLRQWKELLV